MENLVFETFAILTQVFFFKVLVFWGSSMGSPHPPEGEKKRCVGLKDMAVEHLVFCFPFCVYPCVGLHLMI